MSWMTRRPDGIPSLPSSWQPLESRHAEASPRKPQTKGKVERSVEVIKYGFWPGVHFKDLDDLNEQALTWCNRLNQKVHRTTRRVPLALWMEEKLSPLPKDMNWERFGAEERRVSSDGFLSFDDSVGECKQYWNGTMQGKSRQREYREGGESCRCMHESWEPFPRRRCVWPMRPVRKAPWRCGCEMHWENCIRTSSLRRSIQ